MKLGQMKEQVNRLIDEKSPYLHQHAHNPVNWYPWSDEAFEKAKKENKPIFLSIGYSTCHWCHVMERESFEDQEVAAALNEGFVSIKVDREERPDVDAVYMSVCQAMTGSGGWPMTILMTPDQKPFFAGTYFPKIGRYGTAGLLDLLAYISKAWEGRRDELMKQSDKIIAFINENTERKKGRSPDLTELPERAAATFEKIVDRKWGGFGTAPKFPSPHILLFLLRQGRLDLVNQTLVQMYRGGIFDHIGGGFSRYSTDQKWMVPHFEKMLYDNAMLIYAYAEAYFATKKPLFRYVVDRICQYVMGELSDPNGGFYCGQDADSDGVEGKYYVFTPDEVKMILGESEGAAFCDHFDITESGNFEGKSIPNLLKNPKFEKRFAVDKLYAYRLGRVKLHKDDKILTSWNGLTIGALAHAGRLLKNNAYIKRAEEAVEFIWKNMRNDDGSLYVRWKDGERVNLGQLDDYAFLAFALLECYRSTLNAEYLTRAIELSDKMLEDFFDQEHGGFFLYSKNGESLFLRPKEVYDGAMPSGNSMAALVLIRLHKLTGEEKWRMAKERQIDFLAGRADEQPAGQSFFLYGLMEEMKPSKELVYTARSLEGADDLLDLDITILAKTESSRDKIEKAVPFLRQYPIPEEGARYYLCENGMCNMPLDELQDVKEKVNSYN